jgi:uncharacterized protein (TIGR03792 family)
MIVEFITVTCPPGKRDAFIQRDDEVWTAGLMTQPAFLGKEVWTDPNDPDKVYLAIHLKSRELLNAIPQSFCDEMDAAMGDLLMPIHSVILDVARPDPRYRQEEVAGGK